MKQHKIDNLKRRTAVNSCAIPAPSDEFCVMKAKEAERNKQALTVIEKRESATPRTKSAETVIRQLAKQYSLTLFVEKDTEMLEMIINNGRDIASTGPGKALMEYLADVLQNLARRANNYADKARKSMERAD